ncbi:pyridoxal-5'-phosphate-dependent enzyme [Lophiotrema nucula]|uniref:Pyridoxal-5'-phosphate-dependent enzyme n=1 Tax=Lophiotrema nucula TaxID=690887 RepID=A0A6A5Z5A0_9PLEO|nr:pyridoxal-5'-phosphate-dependent enzyme [Lophiotrema nucula]
MSFYKLPTLQAVDRAAVRISRKVAITPVKQSESLSRTVEASIRGESIGRLPEVEVFFKCENAQHTGSFKFRGASHFLARIPDDELKRGVVAYSTGNHALAVAHAAKLASRERSITIPTTVVLPSTCPKKKLNATISHGAAVVLSGPDPEARELLARQIQSSTGAVLVPPADDVNIALGQATLIREFLNQVTDIRDSKLDAIIVPSGGGGLLAGAAAVCRPLGVRLFGAGPEWGGPGLSKALLIGHRTTFVSGDEPPTIADGLRSLTGEANWRIIKDHNNVEGVFTASEDQIREALHLMVEDFGFVVEPSAAVPLAIALFNRDFHRRMTEIRTIRANVRIGIVLTGGNIDVNELGQIVSGVAVGRQLNV